MDLSEFDVIFLDICPIKVRVDWLEKLRSILSHSGVLVIDDIHKPHMRLPMLHMYRNMFDELINLRRITEDEHSRCSAMTFAKHDV